MTEGVEMRLPKWTEEQVEEYIQRIASLEIHGRETPEDIDEVHFCLKYYASTPEGIRREAEIERRDSEVEQAILDQAVDVACAIHAVGEKAILDALNDPKQDPGVKELLAQWFILPRKCVEALLESDISNLHYFALRQPEIRWNDVVRISKDPQREDYVREEAAHRLQTDPRFQSYLMA
jgi:hypothetical protein